MKVARDRALLLIAAAGMAVLLLLAAMAREPKRLPPRAPIAQPTLLLLTSLPLVFGEDFSLKHNGSAALAALERRYRVISISVADAAELGKARLLLMAQPSAQPAEDLVALDRWVQSGGRVLLLADPLLQWPSRRPLGDPLRPATMFMDTGLLGHWGLRLDAPDEPQPVPSILGGFEVLTVSPGRLSGACSISADRVVAHCTIGKGRATIVADADLLDADHLGPRASHNLDGLLEELARLEH